MIQIDWPNRRSLKENSNSAGPELVQRIVGQQHVHRDGTKKRPDIAGAINPLRRTPESDFLVLVIEATDIFRRVLIQVAYRRRHNGEPSS